MSTCKQDKLVSSGICTHPGPHSVVDSLPGGECSGLHHENQHVDQRPAEPIDRHETCTATDPFVVKILQPTLQIVMDGNSLQQLIVNRVTEAPKRNNSRAADMMYMKTINAAVLIEY